jgi:hypothetical protein
MVMGNVNKEWATFSIALFIVWAFVILIRWKIKRPKDIKIVLYIFVGFLIGWLTTTIKFLLINQ